MRAFAAALLLITALFICKTPVFAEEVLRNATITHVEGDVSVKAGAKDWAAAKVGMVLQQHDYIKTGNNSWALLQIDDKESAATVEISQNSQMLIAILTKDSASGSRNTLLDLAIGEVVVQAQKIYDPKSKFEVKTPTSIAGARGTKFSVKVEAAQ